METIMIEYDIAEWILQHKEGLTSKFPKANLERVPDFLLSFYEEQYKEEVLNVIKKECCSGLTLNPEQLALIDFKDLVNKVAKDLLNIKEK